MRDPDALTRVSEYVPQIITFIQQIEKNGTPSTCPLSHTALPCAALCCAALRLTPTRPCVCYRYRVQRRRFSVL